ncbi:ArnT family glycosyltransferase [Gemmatimonadota bacterium]
MAKQIFYLVLVFVAAELYCIYAPFNGPHVDEALSIEIGTYLLKGGDLQATEFLETLNGSPFAWPLFSAIGFMAGGIEGADLMALGFAVLTLVMLSKAVTNLWNAQVATWATLGLAANGQFIRLGHFAVYDSLSLACLSVSFFSLTQYAKDKQRSWIILAAMAIAMAAFAKYPYGVMLFPLSALLITLSTRDVVVGNVGTFLLASTFSIGLCIFLLFGSLEPSSFAAYAPKGRGYLVNILFQLIYLGPPFILVLQGYRLARESREAQVCAVLLATLFLWPMAHVMTNSDTSGDKHVLMGYLFAYPLVGLALSHLWQSRRRYLTMIWVAGIVIWGLSSAYVNELIWPDIRPAAVYLSQHLEAGDHLFAPDQPRGFRLFLQGEGHEDIQLNGLGHHDVCAYTWIVSYEPKGSDTALKEDLGSCDAHRLVFSEPRRMITIRNGVIGVYEDGYHVYRNTESGRVP